VAEAVIDYGRDDDLLWICLMDKGGACYSIPNALIRGVANASSGREKQNLIKNCEACNNLPGLRNICQTCAQTGKDISHFSI
jgi:hypothetical protein